jgi:2-amino-4-hydroxy-6-hydroxymethyldihydropteridine diphosphokinase
LNASENKARQVYIGLGSNISPEINIPRALDLLQEHVSLDALSSIWETPPVGSHGPNFLNAVALISTPLQADQLRSTVLRTIESRLGRIRTRDQNAPRTIDLDILIYGGQVLDENIWAQAHLALPLSELLPDLLRPESGQSILQIARQLARSTSMRKRLLEVDK